MAERQRFDEQSVRRIVKSVLWSERTMRNQVNWPRYYSRRGAAGASGLGAPSDSYIAILSGNIPASPLIGTSAVTTLQGGEADIYEIYTGGVVVATNYLTLEQAPVQVPVRNL
jgi:hypothetical protein